MSQSPSPAPTPASVQAPDASRPPALLYCHCQYAQVASPEVKAAVLKRLCESDLPFEAVPDLCELSARRDPSLKRLAAAGPVKIAACFPRAVKWLFAAADAPLPLGATEVLNLRTQSADEVLSALFSTALRPNLPEGKVTAADAPSAKAPSDPVPNPGSASVPNPTHP